MLIMKWYPCMETCTYLLFLVAWLIPLSSKYTSAGTSLGTRVSENIQCMDKEREALLQFKEGINEDDCGLLTSWAGQECCHWYGIQCSNRSGHVISLDLGGTTHQREDSCSLEGNVSQSLVELKHLKRLDLSFNFHESRETIPSFIGSFRSLKYLDLSNTDFIGEIPYQLANLSCLTFLHLGSVSGDLYSKSLGWLSHLTLLMDMNLNRVNLSLATDWIQAVTNLPFLTNLQMDECSLSSSIPSSLAYTNSSSILRVLSLSFNGLNDSLILQWVANLTNISSTSLEYLDLSYNNFPGLIPGAFGNLGSLVHLDLSSNELQGPIPAGLGQLHLLSHLDLSSNALEGLVPGSIFELELLEYLSLASNNFQGIQFSNSPGSLCRLQTLNLGRNNILNEFSSIMHTFSGCVNNSLVSLNISSNRFWGSIPNLIGAFSSLQELYLNDNQLNGTISPNLGKLSMLEGLDVSSNSLTGALSVHHLSNLSRLLDLDLHDNPELMINISANWVPPFQLTMITLRSCNVGPYFPKWLTTQASLYKIDISNTGISDTIPTSLWNLFSSNLNYLDVSNNDIHGVLPNLSLDSGSANTIDLSSNRVEGAIPLFLGNATTLFLNDNRFYSSIAFFCPKFEVYVNFLDLSNNLLSGELPDCWQGFKYLSALRLDNNNFSGKLPPSLGALNRLSYLSMRNNSFNDELQISVQNWTELLVLDLGFNSFTGHVPVGIGSSLSSIIVLVLGNNKLSGTLPLSLCGLSNLQILDLSYNQISGTIPECICHLRAMTDLHAYTTEISYPGSLYGPDVYATSETIKWKRKEQSFSHTLGLVKYVAISNNQLQGHIPSGISCLKGVASLDFARNNLTGSIPPEIGELTSLEFLDLSRNHLSGQIPSSLAKLTFLGTLDVSYNNLSGKIPTGTQLQGLDPSAFMGNPGLCGPPLAKCIVDTTFINVPKQGNSINREGENNGSDILPGLYISMVLGFIIGFWGVCGTLVIKRSWRHSCLRFVEDMYDRLYVMVVATIPRVWRRP